MSSTASDEITPITSQSKLVRHNLRKLCQDVLLGLLPQTDVQVRGVWNEDRIRKFIAIFELQRVDLHSGLEDERFHTDLIAKAIEELATRTCFHDPCSETLVQEMEIYLRTLACAFRLYKYHGKSLDEKLHQAVYDGITRMSKIASNKKRHRNETQRVEERNVDFLIIHCQYLLTSIMTSSSVTDEVAKRATIAVDGALAGFGSQYNELPSTVAQIIKRKRPRAKWHDEYVRLEDACWKIHAIEISRWDTEYDVDMESIVREARSAMVLLQESLRQCLVRGARQSEMPRVLRQAAGRVTEILQQSGPFEEHGQYLEFGILDLLYQLSFRLNQWARLACFEEAGTIVRMVLEKSAPTVTRLHLKATDVWNRIRALGEKDRQEYGVAKDCEVIRNWSQEHEDLVESYQVSKL